jgi:hypothetical protein
MKNNASFRDLKVWRDAMTLVEDVYRISKGFPPDERFGLTAQLRRAAISIPSNIGEGKRRKRQRTFLHHSDMPSDRRAKSTCSSNSQFGWDSWQTLNTTRLSNVSVK